MTPEPPLGTEHAAQQVGGDIRPQLREGAGLPRHRGQGVGELVDALDGERALVRGQVRAEPRHAVDVRIDPDPALLGATTVPLGKALGVNPVADRPGLRAEARRREVQQGEDCALEGQPPVGVEGVEEFDHGARVRDSHLALAEQRPDPRRAYEQGLRLVGALAHGALGEPETHGEVGDGGAHGELLGVRRGRERLPDEGLGIGARLLQHRVDRGDLVGVRRGHSALGVLGARDARLHAHLGARVVEMRDVKVRSLEIRGRVAHTTSRAGATDTESALWTTLEQVKS